MQAIIPQKFKDDIKAWKEKEVVEKIEPIIEEIKEEPKLIVKERKAVIIMKKTLSFIIKLIGLATDMF